MEGPGASAEADSGSNGAGGHLWFTGGQRYSDVREGSGVFPGAGEAWVLLDPPSGPWLLGLPQLRELPWHRTHPSEETSFI